MPRMLEFFFDYGSPYSYLASTQVEAVCSRAGAELSWRPFLLGAVLKATGTGEPEAIGSMYKARYLLKDLGDWCRHYGLPEFVLPEAFPLNALKADRLGLVALEQGKIAAYTQAVYRAAFVQGQDLSQSQVLTRVLEEVGMDPQASFQRMLSQDIKDRLRQNTDDAVTRGAYGAPTFFVEADMFFGNDRLMFVEAALAR